MTLMSETHTLVFHGEILPGHDPMQVRAALAKLLGLPVQDCDRVFSGQRVVLKRNVAPAESGRYVAHLEKLGARVAVESVAASPVAPSLPVTPVTPVTPVSAVSPVATAAAVEELTCPKCGERQPKRTLCRSCATDMPRFLAAQQEAAAEALALKQAGLAEGNSAAATAKHAADDFDDGPAWIGVNFEGRMGRLDYLFAGMLVTALMTVGLVAALKSYNVALGMAVAVATLVLSLRIVALRCHDLDWSGWFALILAIPYVGAAMSLLLLLLPGQSGDNLYGPPTLRVGLRGVAVGVGSLVLAIALANSFMHELAAVVAAQYGGARHEEVAEGAAGIDPENVRFAADNRVIFYAAPNCPCVGVRQGLENMGVDAQLRIIDDLSSDEQDALHDRIVKAGLPTNPTRLPVVDVNGVLLEDPSPEAIIAKLRVER